MKLPKLEYYFLCGKVNFIVIHPTHIIIYSFWRTTFSSKGLSIIGKSYILTVKNNDNWTFLVFSVFKSHFLWSQSLDYINYLLLLKLILHLYRWAVAGHKFWNSITFLVFKTSLAITPLLLSPASFIMVDCLIKPIYGLPFCLHVYFHSYMKISQFCCFVAGFR